MKFDSMTTLYTQVDVHIHKLIQEDSPQYYSGYQYLQNYDVKSLKNGGRALFNEKRQLHCIDAPAVMYRDELITHKNTKIEVNTINTPKRATDLYIENLRILTESYYILEAWYLDGRLHRDNGPAVRDNNMEIYYKHGICHRSFGPAFIRYGLESWVFYDQNVTDELLKWAEDNGIELDNLSEEDKSLMKMKWELKCH